MDLSLNKWIQQNVINYNEKLNIEKSLEVRFQERTNMPSFEEIRMGDIFKIFENTLVYSCMIEELCYFSDKKYIKVVGKTERTVGDLILFHLLEEDTYEEKINAGVFDVNYTFLNLP